MRTDIHIEDFKARLLKEKETVLEELKGLGHTNPQNKNDWVAESGDLNRGEADPIDRADNFEELETNTAIVGNLETRLNNIEAALKRIEDDTYGYCKISNEPIEVDRLEANPAAETCKAHIDAE